jgi:hypothetical protein
MVGCLFGSGAESSLLLHATWETDLHGLVDSASGGITIEVNDRTITCSMVCKQDPPGHDAP